MGDAGHGGGGSRSGSWSHRSRSGRGGSGRGTGVGDGRVGGAAVLDIISLKAWRSGRMQHEARKG